MGFYQLRIFGWGNGGIIKTSIDKDVGEHIKI